MAKKKTNTLDDLKRMAEEYGIADNALLTATIEQYSLQKQVIDTLKEAINDSDSLTTKKSYIKGSANEYMNPLVKELPKHSDSMNRTAQTMLNIIIQLGSKPQPKGKLNDFLEK